MSPNADSDEQSPRSPLPFEPSKRRKPAPDSAPKNAAKATPAVAKSTSPKKAAVSQSVSTQKASPQAPVRLEQSRIPEIVSRRMLRRMALLCGVPSFLGMFTFLISYFLVTQDIVALPTYVVVLVSLGCLGLGVVGLSYGVLSASWDEEIAGSWLGWSEFTTNLGRMTGAWRSDKSSN